MLAQQDVTRGGRTQGEDTGDGVLLNDGWEQNTVVRLNRLLRYAELEKLLGPLLKAIRQARRAETNIDRRGKKSELAAALVIQHRTDLFAQTDIRQAIARASNQEYPDRWHPGSTAALEFVAATE